MKLNFTTAEGFTNFKTRYLVQQVYQHKMTLSLLFNAREIETHYIESCLIYLGMVE